MKQTNIIIAILAVLVISTIGLVYAHGSGSGYGMMGGFGMMGNSGSGYGMMGSSNYDIHEEMEEVMESGSYQDLVELREEYNMPMMYWVDSEEEFLQAQQIHEEFEEEGYRGGCHWR